MELSSGDVSGCYMEMTICNMKNDKFEHSDKSDFWTMHQQSTDTRSINHCMQVQGK